jgi:hypothetical protein
MGKTNMRYYRYRAAEVRDRNGDVTIVVETEARPAWWPFWSRIGRVFDELVFSKELDMCVYQSYAWSRAVELAKAKGAAEAQRRQNFQKDLKIGAWEP